MEIKNLRANNAIRTYEKLSSSLNPKKSGEKSASNTDKVDFDFMSSIAAAKANAASSIDAEANAAKIAALQAQYQGESCPVSSEDIAKAIVGE
ncbi:MAG: hypothetical protein J1F60_03735 [Oscillospiraceae bacterium]|nr:hypothetical protein [Oscillospiraceae bacterium]